MNAGTIEFSNLSKINFNAVNIIPVYFLLFFLDPTKSDPSEHQHEWLGRVLIDCHHDNRRVQVNWLNLISRIFKSTLL